MIVLCTFTSDAFRWGGRLTKGSPKNPHRTISTCHPFRHVPPPDELQLILLWQRIYGTIYLKTHPGFEYLQCVNTNLLYLAVSWGGCVLPPIAQLKVTLNIGKARLGTSSIMAPFYSRESYRWSCKMDIRIIETQSVITVGEVGETLSVCYRRRGDDN